jgi:hypothetical protein
MKKILLSISACLTVCLVFGQVQMNLPVTFQDPTFDYSVVGFGGAEASSIEADPTDAMNTVAKVIKSGSAETWAGTTLTNTNNEGFSSAIPFDATHTTMTVRVWSPDAGIPVRLKVEDWTDNTHSVETDAYTTLAGEWETLTFNFANEGAGTAPIDLSYYYNKASIFFNYNVAGSVTGEKTYYFDDVMMGGETAVQIYNVTFSVDMNGQTGFTTPAVNGTFNGWCGACIEMTDSDANGVWEVTVPLEAGSYEYKFTTDGWNDQEYLTQGMPCTVTGEFTNRSLTVADNAVLPTVCWESCNACDVVVSTYNVTFSVDMNGQTGFTTPALNGTFNGWCGACIEMTDADANGIWEVTVPLEAGSYEYKFTTDGWNDQEYLTEGIPCTVTNNGFTNRSLTVADNAVLPTVCWESCNACDVVVSTYNVTFRVDMANVTDPFTTPEVNGTFNGWCGGCAPMSDIDGDNVWELTIALEPGTYEFKYAYDSWAGQESLLPGTPCTITASGFTNRLIEVSSDLDLGVVCWAACTSCENANGPYDVTFKVDMSQYSGTYTTPEVNGTFNNWCGNCAPMTDADGDNIWEITIPLYGGEYNYKFSHDAWTGQEALTDGSACTTTIDGFTNRYVMVEAATELTAVCWASCEACSVSVAEATLENALVYPNPANNELTIQLAATKNQSTTVRMYAITGQLVYQANATNTGLQTIPTSNLSEGMYEVQISNATQTFHHKVMIQH